MVITLSDEATAMLWDDYLRSFGVDAYVEARYAPPKTISSIRGSMLDECETETLKAA